MKLMILCGGSASRRRLSQREPSATSARGAIALSSDDGLWALVNVAPNVAQQIDDDPVLSVAPGLSAAGSRTVVLTDAQVDHMTGLLALRDGGPIDLYATPAVFEVLSQTTQLLPLLQQYCDVHWHMIPVAGESQSARFRVAGMGSLEFIATATDTPAPPYVPDYERSDFIGLSIALTIRDLHSGQQLFVAPGGQAMDVGGLEWMKSSDCLLLDAGTSWPEADDVPAWKASRRVVIGQLPERAPLRRMGGFEAAYDGMVIEL